MSTSIRTPCGRSTRRSATSGSAPDGNDQYVEVKAEFSNYVDDPYVEPGFTREPLLRRGRRRHHRRRLRRPADGRPAARGRLRPHPPDREGGRRRRHLVLEPLPGRHVRRASRTSTCRCWRRWATSRSTSTPSRPRSSSTASAIARHYRPLRRRAVPDRRDRDALGRGRPSAGSSAPTAATA